MRPYLVETLNHTPDSDVVIRTTSAFVCLKHAKDFAERQKSIRGFVRCTIYELCLTFDRILDVIE